MDFDEAAVREAHSTWIAAVNGGNLDRLLARTTDDAIFLGPGQTPFGRIEFSANFSAAHRDLLIDCVSELEEVVLVGEVAYTRSRDFLSVTPRSGGNASKHAGYRLTVYRKQSDGCWLLARDVHTLSPA